MSLHAKRFVISAYLSLKEFVLIPLTKETGKASSLLDEAMQ